MGTYVSTYVSYHLISTFYICLIFSCVISVWKYRFSFVTGEEMLSIVQKGDLETLKVLLETKEEGNITLKWIVNCTMRKNLPKTLYQLIFCKCTLVCSQIY